MAQQNDDNRFAPLFTEQKYKVKVGRKKTKVDKRFKEIFTDKEFRRSIGSGKYGTDEHFEPSQSYLDDLYKLKSSDEESENDKDFDQKDEESSVTSESSAESSDSESSDLSFCSNQESDQEQYDDNVFTHRLALTKVDWDNIKAQDIFMLCKSFLPANKKINSVKVYPSEYGKSQMSKENSEGPKELFEIEEEGSDNKKSRKLRKYQFKRLYYHYAIIECDCIDTAKHIYKQLNGYQFLDSIMPLNFKCVPNDMVFNEEPASEAFSESKSYEPLKKLSKNAFQQVNYKPNWDENDPHREQFMEKAFADPDNINEDDLKAYLASSSEDSEDEKQTEQTIQKLREFLSSADDEKLKDKSHSEEQCQKKEEPKSGNIIVNFSEKNTTNKQEASSDDSLLDKSFSDDASELHINKNESIKKRRISPEVTEHPDKKCKIEKTKEKIKKPKKKWKKKSKTLEKISSASDVKLDDRFAHMFNDPDYFD